MPYILKTYFRISTLKSCVMAVFALTLFFTVIGGCRTTRSLSSKNSIDSSLVYSPGGEYASMRIPALVLTKKGTCSPETECT